MIDVQTDTSRFTKRPLHTLRSNYGFLFNYHGDQKVGFGLIATSSSNIILFFDDGTVEVETDAGVSTIEEFCEDSDFELLNIFRTPEEFKVSITY